jgi:fructokinase
VSQRYKIVGLGEVLWDMLPDGKQLGGAPSNFAYISTLLGNEGIVASRLGTDALGEEAAAQLAKVGVSTAAIQRDPERPTGTVQVEVDDKGQPTFQIKENVAWDFLEWTPDWQKLAAQSDAVCFGSLAQRGEASRSTIRQFLAATRKDAVRIFDVNLRQTFHSRDVLAESMKVAEIVKLNHEELPRVMEILSLVYCDDISSARLLIDSQDLQLVCITRGEHGSLLLDQRIHNEHSGYRVRIGDTIGAGDAFTAALVYEYLRGRSLAGMNETANRMGAWVASRVGAMPTPAETGIWQELSGVGSAHAPSHIARLTG